MQCGTFLPHDIAKPRSAMSRRHVETPSKALQLQAKKPALVRAGTPPKHEPTTKQAECPPKMRRLHRGLYITTCARTLFIEPFSLCVEIVHVLTLFEAKRPTAKNTQQTPRHLAVAVFLGLLGGGFPKHRLDRCLRHGRIQSKVFAAGRCLSLFGLAEAAAQLTLQKGRSTRVT
jgi:hypothetical protein